MEIYFLFQYIYVIIEFNMTDKNSLYILFLIGPILNIHVQEDKKSFPAIGFKNVARRNKFKNVI
jgi:hypothetical protein